MRNSSFLCPQAPEIHKQNCQRFGPRWASTFNLPWEKLADGQRRGARVLGYESDTWPATQWAALTEGEQQGARELGYDAATWLVQPSFRVLAYTARALNAAGSSRVTLSL